MNEHKLYIDIERIVLNWRAYSCDNEFTSDIFHSAKNHFEELEADNREKDARIAELEAENTKLREALKQLHDAAQDIDVSEMSLSIREWWRNELRAARAALGENKP